MRKDACSTGALSVPLAARDGFFRLSPANYYAGLHSALDDLYGDTLRPVTLTGTSAPRRFRAQCSSGPPDGFTRAESSRPT